MLKSMNTSSQQMIIGLSFSFSVIDKNLTWSNSTHIYIMKKPSWITLIKRKTIFLYYSMNRIFNDYSVLNLSCVFSFFFFLFVKLNYNRIPKMPLHWKFFITILNSKHKNRIFKPSQHTHKTGTL